MIEYKYCLGKKVLFQNKYGNINPGTIVTFVQCNNAEQYGIRDEWNRFEIVNADRIHNFN